MARAATAGELTKFRGNGFSTRLYLAVWTAPTVFSARVNQSFTSLDKVTQITYDGSFGNIADVLPGMTMYVGTNAGNFDKGMVRVRSVNATTIVIGETSEIAWADNDYLTIVREWTIWPRHIRVDGETFYMDGDVAYTDQHSAPDPIACAGPDVALWLTGATVTYSPPNGAQSWAPDGSSITGYSWSAPGASATSGMNTATPTFTYNAGGQYYYSLTVTLASGKTNTTYRYLWVCVPTALPTSQFVLLDCRGNYEQGGWTYSVQLYDEANLVEVRDRTKCLLFARDWYQGTEGSIGPISGAENVICSGWVIGESIVNNPQYGTVDFTVAGPQYWMSQIAGFPAGLEDTAFADNGEGAPNRWTEYQNLTVKAMVWHMIHWRSTLDMCVDVLPPSAGSAIVAQIAAASGSLWEQLRVATYDVALARCVCDRYGIVYTEIDSQFIVPAQRSSIPVVMDVTEADVMNDVGILRQTMTQAALVEVLGVLYVGGVDATPAGGVSPGAVFRMFGSPVQFPNLAFDSEADAITLAGLIAGQLCNEFPETTFALGQNNRLIDIAPRQYVTMSLSAYDTERGFTWTTKKLIPRDVAIIHTKETGRIHVELMAEAETTALNAVAMAFPGSSAGEEGPGGGVDPPDPPDPPGNGEPPGLTLEGSGTVIVATSTAVKITANFTGASPSWTDITSGISGEIYDGCFSAAYSEIKYAFIAAGAKIFRSSDLALGAPYSWTQVYDGSGVGSNATAWRVVSRNGPNIYALLTTTSGSSASVWCVCSQDNGTTWGAAVDVYTSANAVTDYTVDVASVSINRPGTSRVYAYTTHARKDGSSTYNPWGMAYKAEYTSGEVISAIWDNRNTSAPYNGNTINDFNSGIAYADGTIYGKTNSSLSAGQKTTAEGWMNAYFGAGAWTNAGTGSMPKQSNRIYAGFSSGDNQGIALITSYIFWNYPQLDISKAIDASPVNGARVLIGGSEGLFESLDHGVHWALIAETPEADDIKIIRQCVGFQYYVWDNTGKLYQCYDAATLQPVLITASASEVQQRIADDPITHRPTYALKCAGGDVFDLVEYFSGAVTARQSSISGARSLKLYRDKKGGHHLYWLSSSLIQYSTDRGVTAQDKTGDYGSLSGPVAIIPIP